MAKILVADDEATLAKLVQLSLSRKGHQVTIVSNGNEALSAFSRERFDVLVTDWMMPELDGLGLIRALRRMVRPSPGIVMMTAIMADKARETALDAGADEYVEKPFLPQTIIDAVERCLARLQQSAPPAIPRPTAAPPPAAAHSAAHSTPATAASSSHIAPRTRGLAPFQAVVMASSTGGPEAVVKVLRGMGACPEAAFFLVQHGPAWMLESFAKRLANETPLCVHLASDDLPVEAGHLYLAPGERHLGIRPSYRTQLLDEPPENFVRPAADPLFRTAAQAFGSKCLAVVLTGMGRDGMLGALQVAEHGGTVLVQDPQDAVVPSMPQSVISSGVRHKVLPLDALGSGIARHVRKTPSAG